MRFGPFEIVRPLGRGGMAETFLARRASHDGFTREICVKRVLAERAVEPDFVRSFQREAKLAARLVHPHIAQVYDFGCEGETWWMALEHVPGGDLRALLKSLGQPMPVDLGLVLMVDMLEALGYAHEQGVVHRDVSPSNILVDLQGNFKLADFGIAKARHVDRDGTTAFSTTTGTIKGKAAYMAPEQALGLEVDGRADLWSFGIVMFEAFASAKPFDGPTDLATMMAASQGRRALLVEAAPHVPPDLAAVIEKLLEPNRDRRFQNAGEVLEALSGRPAPIQGRKRIARMLETIGAARAQEAPTEISRTAPEATVVEPLAATTSSSVASTDAPSEPRTAGAVAESMSSAPRTTPVSAPASAMPATVPPLASTLSAIPEPRPLLPRAVAVIAVALVAGVVTALVIVGAAVPPSITAAMPWRATSPSSTSSVPSTSIAPPPTTPLEVHAPPPTEPPRGVLVPDESELPVLEAATTPRTTTGRTTTGRAPDPTRTSAPAAAQGSLHVTVIPWGDVRVDGRPLGRSPVTVPLPAGSHRVQIESESGSETRVVQISAGQREELEVDLSDG
ncbi:MAG: protein kinase [Sandaracinaceae bacterium]|nr:protein kinase [Sandaracinaceae bacterium]